VRRALIAILLAACSSSSDAQPTSAPPPAPAPIDAAPPPPPDARITSHVIVRGDHLDDIAQAAYGSRHYSRLIALVDQVEATKLKVGATLALPSIDEICAPLATRVPDGTAALLRAHAAWRGAVDALWDEHRNTRKISSRKDVAQAAADAELARAAFAKAKMPTTQLKSLVGALDSIAAGAIDPEGYALDDADRRFAYAIADLLSLAR
jgi:nucleoid-associated protein YgaU